MFRSIITALALSMACLSAGAAEDIQIGLSNESVSITSNFSGTTIAVFGSIENGDEALLRERGYDIVVALVGPVERVVVRRKQKRVGIWVNGASQRFAEVPASYSVATTKKLDAIVAGDELKTLQIGLRNLQLQPDGETEVRSDISVFRDSLTRLKVSQDLYLESVGGVEFLSPSLFRAKLMVPANVPIGYHRARAYLFKNGEFITTRSTLLNVRKTGFEQFTYNLAHQQGWLYGILAVLVAIATGWIASVVFRKD